MCGESEEHHQLEEREEEGSSQPLFSLSLQQRDHAGITEG